MESQNSERWRTGENQNEEESNSCGVALKSSKVHECRRHGACKRNERKKEER